MSGEPVVSVVMSVYNEEVHLRAAVESLLRQEGIDFEVIAVNDGSKDGSGALLDQMAAIDSRLRVIHQENTGLTRALIRGCIESKGEFIARQDADDVSLPGRLAREAEALRSDATLSMVSCSARAVAPDGELLWETRRSSDPDVATKRLVNNFEGPPCHGAVMFRRSVYEAVGGYRWQFWFAQDSDLWLRMAERGRFLCVPECLYLYRIGDWSISSMHRNVQTRFGVMGHLSRACRLQGDSEDGVLAEAASLTQEVAAQRRGAGRKAAAAYMIGRWLLRERHPAAVRYLRRATRAEPWNLKAWLSLLQARFVDFAPEGDA